MFNLIYLFFVFVLGVLSLSLIMVSVLAVLGEKKIKLPKYEVLFMRYSKNLFLLLVIGLFFYMLFPGGLMTEKTKFFSQKTICRSNPYPDTVINDNYTLSDGFLYHGFYTKEVIDVNFTKEYIDSITMPCGPSFGIDYTGFGTFKSNLCAGSNLYPFYMLDIIFLIGMIMYCILFLISVEPKEYDVFEVIKIRGGYLLFFVVAFFILSFANFYGGVALSHDAYCLSRDYSFLYWSLDESCFYNSINKTLKCESFFGDGINGNEH